MLHLTAAKKTSHMPALIYKPAFFCSKWCFRTFWLLSECPSDSLWSAQSRVPKAQSVLISGAFVSHFIWTESCAIIIQWFTLCSQNTPSYLLRGCRDAGWVDGWGRRQRERERLFLYLTLSRGKWLSSLPHNMKPESIPTSRALDPGYSRWWHSTMCRRWEGV